MTPGTPNNAVASGDAAASPALRLQRPIGGVAPGGAPLQAGMPALLELIGADASGFTSEDLAVFTPDAAASLSELSGFDQ